LAIYDIDIFHFWPRPRYMPSVSALSSFGTPLAIIQAEHPKGEIKMSDWSRARHDVRSDLYCLRRALEERRISSWWIFAAGVLVGGFFF
jgi:hypothetical protein